MWAGDSNPLRVRPVLAVPQGPTRCSAWSPAYNDNDAASDIAKSCCESPRGSSRLLVDVAKVLGRGVVAGVILRHLRRCLLDTTERLASRHSLVETLLLPISRDWIIGIFQF